MCSSSPAHTGDNPGVLRTEHLQLESFAEDHARFVLVEIADDDSHGVLLKTNDTKVMHGRRKFSPRRR